MAARPLQGHAGHFLSIHIVALHGTDTRGAAPASAITNTRFAP